MNYTAEQILAVSVSDYSKIFKNKSKLRQDFARLLMKWHPDTSSCNEHTATAVTSHLTSMHKVASKDLKNGCWREPNVMLFRSKSPEGKSYKISYINKRETYHGDMYFSRKTITYFFRRGHKDFFANFINRVEEISYPDNSYKKANEPFMPSFKGFCSSEDGFSLFVAKEPKGYFLSDIYKAYGPLDPVHVAWIGNRLYAICNVLMQNGISHNSIGLDSVILYPESHHACLVGGWEFSTRYGQAIKFVPSLTKRFAPSKVLQSKNSNSSALDLSCVRATLRSLLGDQTGMTLSMRGVPEKMSNFLLTSRHTNAYDEFAEWQNVVLKECFGERKFVNFEFSEEKIFKSRR